MKTSKIHPSAIVSKKAELGKNVSIGPYSVVEAGAVLHDDVVLHAHTLIAGGTSLGQRSIVFSFSALGYPPQDLSYQGEKTSLTIGHDTIIRENVTMHRGTIRGKAETKVGCHGYFMVGSHVAHDCQIGDHVIFAQGAVVGGHVTVGDYCNLGGKSAIHQFSQIGKFAFIGSKAMVTRDVIPYGIVFGNHAKLAGLNIVGLKRNNFSREKIQTLRSAFAMLFSGEDVFEQRISAVAKKFGSSQEVMHIIDFIQGDRTRALCLPNDK